MTELLTELLNAGLIENLNGHDDRFNKIQQAAETVTEILCEQPSQLIRAILAGLDPDISADDPAIIQAEQALVAQWPTMRSVFTDSPVNLLRAILLAACQQAAEDKNNASILWLTAADTLPLLKLGKEEPVIRKLLSVWATSVEKLAFTGLELSAEEQATTKDLELPELTESESHKVDRDTLLQKVTVSVGPGGNPHTPAQGQAWSNEFSPRMTELLADELDSLALQLNESQSECITKLSKSVSEVLKYWVKQTQQAEQIRLNALWWSEALYSSSLQCSYRELSPAIASVATAIDLLNAVTKPTPASVSYLLAETVNRLPKAGFNQKMTLKVLFESLKQSKKLTKEWLQPLTTPPETGRLSLRDAVFLILTGQEAQVGVAIKRTGADGEFELSLPQFAQALFRQEQAVQLAGAIHG